MDRCMNGYTVERMDKPVDDSVGGWISEYMVGWTDRWKVRSMDA